jgi:hypothetical protein
LTTIPSQHLADLTNLETVQLGGTRITDAGLQYLNGLSHLQEVYGSPRVTDGGAERLRQALPKASVFHVPDKDRK